jgi:hypothetical protein
MINLSSEGFGAGHNAGFAAPVFCGAGYAVGEFRIPALEKGARNAGLSTSPQPHADV